MEQHYSIAGLTVKMDSFGRTVTQAEPYRCSPAPADIVIETDWKALQQSQPYLSDEDCEYLASGGCFYRHLLKYDGMFLHSCAVVVDGWAYLFSAPSGTGKSTHVQLWLKALGDRAFILNDDKPALRLEDGVWYAYGTPWSGKHDLSVNTRVKLGGICVLRRAAENSIAPLSGTEAIFALLDQTSRPTTPAARLRMMELLDNLLAQVPVWQMGCNMDPQAAMVSYNAMVRERKE